VGPLAYVVYAVRHVTNRSMSVEIVLDDGPALHRRARSVLAANVGRLPGGARLLADADPDDGLMDIAVISSHGPVQWLRTGWAVLRRREQAPSMEVHRAAHAVVTSDRDQPREATGTTSNRIGSSTSGCGPTRCGCASTSRTRPRTWPTGGIGTTRSTADPDRTHDLVRQQERHPHEPHLPGRRRPGGTPRR